MFNQNQTVQNQATAVKAEAEAEVKAESSDKATARKASTKKMLEHKKQAIKTLVEYAKRMNADGKDQAVAEATRYMSGDAHKNGVQIIDLVNKIFATSKTVTGVEIFSKFDKGKLEMASLMKKAEAKGIKITYDATAKTYTKQ